MVTLVQKLLQAGEGSGMDKPLLKQLAGVTLMSDSALRTLAVPRKARTMWVLFHARMQAVSSTGSQKVVKSVMSLMRMAFLSFSLGLLLNVCAAARLCLAPVSASDLPASGPLDADSSACMSASLATGRIFLKRLCPMTSSTAAPFDRLPVSWLPASMQLQFHLHILD